MALVSPGVEVQVIDESFYTPAGAGTVPMIFVATAQDKVSSSGSGVARGTLKTNAGKPFLITSQRELGETFGDATFYSDANGNMIHAGELNEYGLQTAYSLLGVSNRAYVTRADFDLSKIAGRATAPGGEPEDGTYWLDTGITQWGLLEWNSAPITAVGGQTFTSVTPIILNDSFELDGSAPKQSVGLKGDYAVVTYTNSNTVYYKNYLGTWVAVGSDVWKASWPTITGSSPSPALTNGESISLNGGAVLLAGTDVQDMADAINGAGITGITSDVIDERLAIFSTGVDIVVAGSATLLSELGITAGTYAAPELTIAPHTLVPDYKTNTNPRPTGSLWLKTTVPNGGANVRVNVYNADTQLWETASAPLYTNERTAIAGLDTTGGTALQAGDLFVKANINETSAPRANYTIYRRVTSGATRVVSDKITTQLAGLTGAQSFQMAESRANASAMSSLENIPVTIAGDSTDAETIAAAINSSALVNVSASVDTLNRIVIQHKLGGEIHIDDTSTLMAQIFTVYDPASPNYTTANFYAAPSGIASIDYVVSNWRPLVYEAGENAPTSLAPDGELWYNSTVSDVDIMIHNGTTWRGYVNEYPDTDPAGPLVRASEPTEQSDGSALVDNDLWIDTSDIENYPMLYRYNTTLDRWILVDKTDQTTENGILFADARWGSSGANSAEPEDISDLLTSNYLDPDAPDPVLYPKGMLLWNLRRSGGNVKRFERNYIDLTAENTRFGDEDMALYYPHRWVTDSGNNEDGSGTFGRHAQRKSVVQALQAVINNNDEIRDEEARQFNLIACPGYPELIGEMITLNYDRRLTAFVVGDSPARLTPDATSLNEWGTNVRNAVEDNDQGLVSRDEYLGVYYPWGFTSDNFGNNVVVPPSHMALRTLILNDQVAYPWFAPAGTRRGGVTNATASGYVNSEGEFVSVALNTGQRDTLYTNNINPITFLSGSGLTVFGQKTRARNASALDRINVARLIVYMRTQLEQLARPYLFEPNDRVTRDQIKAAAESFCLELVSLRALYDFLVVCDETNNTPARIDRNELYLDIAIEPVKAIEFIYIPLRIKNTGEIAELV